MTKKYIVLHHSATPDSVVYRDFDAIKRGHLARGWRDIGYHYVIEKINGRYEVLEGRRENEQGAHSVPRNVDGIGICMVGNFETEQPTDELYRIVANLCLDIMTRHNIKIINGHRDNDATACPGKNFDVERVKQLVKGGDIMQEVKVFVKGKEVKGKLIDGQTYVPLRELIEMLNNKITWEGKNNVARVE